MPLPAASGRSRFLQSPQALLDTTMDQLRTLIVVREAGTALGAARILGREQSSVQKQLDTLNRNFLELCGEPLVRKQGRGKNVQFTRTGEILVERARGTLGDWLDGIQEARRRLGATLTVGTTRFTLQFVASAGELVADEFRERDIELRVVHVRTRDLLDKLDSHEVDLVCGSIVTTSEADPRLDGYDVMAWRRSGLSLVTNLPEDQVPATIGTSELHTLPLVVASSGVITSFLSGWFGSDYRHRLDIAAEIDAVHYGLELLGSGLLHGCMLVTQGVGEATNDGRLPDGRGLRTIELINDVGPELQVLVGAFTRKTESQPKDKSHPLGLLWKALATEHAQWRRLAE